MCTAGVYIMKRESVHEFNFPSSTHFSVLIPSVPTNLPQSRLLKGYPHFHHKLGNMNNRGLENMLLDCAELAAAAPFGKPEEILGGCWPPMPLKSMLVMA